jgi:hypothetical protein
LVILATGLVASSFMFFYIKDHGKKKMDRSSHYMQLIASQKDTSHLTSSWAILTRKRPPRDRAARQGSGKMVREMPSRNRCLHFKYNNKDDTTIHISYKLLLWSIWILVGYDYYINM